MILKKAEKVVSNIFFRTTLRILGAITGLILVINFFGKIVRFLISLSTAFWRIFNRTVPIYIVLVIFVLILIVFLLIRLRKLRLNEKETFILAILDEREIGLNLLFKLYKQRFEKESRTMSHCLVTIKQLEMKKLINCAALSGGINGIQDELFQLTKKGQKRFKELDSIIIVKAENIYNKISDMPKMKLGSRELKRIEPHKEIMFILELLESQQNRSMTKTALSNHYFKNYSNKKVIDFNILWNRLETGDLIMEYRASIGYGRSDIYFITEEGLGYLWTFRNKE